MTAHWLETKISPHYVDGYGHMNNAAYMSVFETARWDWLKSKGLDQNDLSREGMGPVVLEARLEFRRELKLDDRIKVLTEVTTVRSRSFEVYHEIRSSEDQLACRAYYKLGFLNLATRKISSPNDKWRQIFDDSL